MTKRFTHALTRGIACYLIFLIFGFLSGCSSRSAGDKERVILAVGGKTAIAYLPITIAEQKGFFAEEGLELEIQDLQGGSKALQALVAGSADVVVGYYDHTIQMQAKNKDITAIVDIARYPGFVLAVRSDLAERVQSVSDLRGLKIGVTAPGSSSQFLIEYLIAKEGLKSDDVAIVGVGAASTAVAAVEQKQVDALVNLDPMITVMDRRGLIKILIDTRREDDSRAIFGGEYPGAVVYTTREFVERRQIAAGRLANAFVRALRWMHGKQPEEIAHAVPENYFAGDRDAYLKGLADSMAMFSPDGRFSESAPEKVLNVLSVFDKQVAHTKIDLFRTYTNRFVDQANSQHDR